VTKPFTDILLQFLVQRIRDLSSSDKHEGQVDYELFIDFQLSGRNQR